MPDDTHHAERIAVLEAEVKAIAAGHRDVWDSIEKLRSCLISGLTEIRKDAAASSDKTVAPTFTSFSLAA